VDVEGAGTFRIEAGTAQALGIEAGAMLEPAVVAQIAQASARQEARSIALALLQRRLRSRMELEHALRRRKVPAEAILAVSAELRRTGWLDDARFARLWVQDRLAVRPCGPRRLTADLRAKGVEGQIIHDTIASLVPGALEDDLAARQAQVQWQRLRQHPPAVARRRLAAWLQRRGYRGEVIARVLRSTSADPIDDPNVDPAA
jgi:regulatory protein